jgi:uncharacterized membrane protein YsdA (DUF1294 family)
MTDFFALSPDLVLALAGYMVLANLLALLTAHSPEPQDGEWQAADSRLLFLAAMGGWIGAKLGQALFRRQGPGGIYGKVLNLSVLVLPVVLAIPLLMDIAPGFITQSVADYAAQYAGTQAATDPTAAQPLADAAGSDALATGSAPAVDSGTVVATTATAAPALPKRFGPGSGSKTKKTSQKTVSVGN